MKNTREKRPNRKSSKGATRKSKAVMAKKTRSFAWLNRMLILMAVVAVTALAGKGYIALHAIPVEHIIVSGKLEHTKTAALEKMVRPALVGGFLNADLERIRAQLQRLPWVYEVSVRRRWPNALELHVVEQLPIARWGTDGFLNHEGVVFQSGEVEQDWSVLPLLRGPQGAASALMGIYQQAIEILSPEKLIVKELTVDDRGQVTARLRGDTVLVIGGEDFVEERLRRFVAVYRAELATEKDRIARVDLRYQNGLAVDYRESPRVAGL
ncbi:MAG: FtsQ-type POTRA domain-containing protein [Proteobacteria bacterium]|nr:FtsQ-type POTRA domain-containing protein [Pseudomonadota bacterium]